jgi:gamma-glutamylcyclotransferase
MRAMSTTSPPEAGRWPFLYFAFGSNLDEARLHIHCPSARLVTIARLADHRLAFSIESKRNWHGGVADVRPAPGDEVWGALWLIDGAEGHPLDEQEGVSRDPPAYRRIAVEVDTPAGDRVRCRSYQVVTPDREGFLPSPAYKQTILRGARALSLPPDYIARLEALADNGYEGGGPA